MLEVLTKIENRGAYDIARRIRNLCSQVFQYGVNAGKCEYNPARDLQGALTARKRKHFAALEPSEIPDLLMALDKNDARLFALTRRAIKLSMLTFVRPGEIRQAVWDEFDLENKEWLIPAERMKSRKAHIVPLSKQSINVLKEQKEETGHFKSGYVFPGQNNQSRPMSENTVCVALVKLGFQGRMTAHGFRALARTTIREKLDYAPDVIEMQLAHKPAGRWVQLMTVPSF
ncbi:tyrosine-type recombinase/integrase [Flavobacterium sp. 3HN19-14]|uniref:tyrosine-type recombinase/integrase n=1 Tax=Flavobacterium sp. 3HN19-14 TaxID=3448133 RepID=UPI003EE2ABC7